MAEYEVDVVLYPEGDHWVAQGLQYDITAQAKEQADLPGKFMLAFASEVVVAMELGEEPLVSIPQAPQKFFQMFERATATLQIDEPPALRMENSAFIAPRVHPRMKVARSQVAA